MASSAPERTPRTAGQVPVFLRGGGEMGALMRAHDWGSSTLGPPEGWPPQLCTVVGLMLGSKFPMFVAWGPDLAFLYNDGYSPIFGTRHPAALGRPFAEVWSDIWEDIRPLVDHAMAGHSSFHENLPLTMMRNGFPEETYFTFSYSPVQDGTGTTVGMFCACTETTEKVMAERRLREAEADLRAANGALARLNETLEERVAERTAERERAEAELRQAQKMEAVGQLTGGVAHDFNNLLQAMTGCLQMIQRRADNPAVRPLVEAGQQAIDRGAKLIQQLMAFSRRQSLRPEPVDVRDRILSMSELLVRALRADITVETDFATDLWPIEVDPTQFELSIINLAVNARDAMPTGGTLRISAQNAPDTDGGPDMVRLTVSDTGHGMSPEVMSRAFEPFFTTKAVGKGSGLGLAQVYGFARQSGGRAELDSAAGAGTRIALLLPRTGRRPGETLPPAALEEAVSTGTRILLVEDEPVVARMVTAVLEDLGYRIIAAANAAEALSILGTDAEVDLLFSDVVMPGMMNGVELVRRSRELRPRLPAVLATGYSKDAAGIEGVRLLTKPYHTTALVQALEEALVRTGFS